MNFKLRGKSRAGSMGVIFLLKALGKSSLLKNKRCDNQFSINSNFLYSNYAGIPKFNKFSMQKPKIKKLNLTHKTPVQNYDKMVVFGFLSFATPVRIPIPPAAGPPA